MQFLTCIPPWCMASLQVLLSPLPAPRSLLLMGFAPLTWHLWLRWAMSFNSLSCELEVRSIVFRPGELSLTWRATECVKIYL